MNDNKKVKFVRIRGRVVPIRRKEKDELKQGLALAGAGSSVAVGGSAVAGYSAKKFFKSQSIFESMTQNISATRSFIPTVKNGILTTKPRSVGGSSLARKLAYKKSQRQFFKTKAYHDVSYGFMRGSSLLSSALVGLGVKKFLDASGYEESDLGKEYGSEVVGFTAGAINQALSHRTYRKFAYNEGFYRGISKDVKKGSKVALNALKTVSKFAIKKKLKL